MPENTDPIPGVDNPPPQLEGLTTESLLEQAKGRGWTGLEPDQTLQVPKTGEPEPPKEPAEPVEPPVEPPEGGERPAEPSETPKEPKETPPAKPDIDLFGLKEQEKAEEAEKNKAREARDADLERISAEAGANVGKSARKVIERQKVETIRARDEAEARAKEAAELKRKVEELEKRPPSVPKEMEEKLKIYEERIRELDITKDPEFETRFDKKIKANDDGIVKILKEQGADKAAVYRTDASGQIVRDAAGHPIIDHYNEDPDNLETIIRGGLTIQKLGPHIEALKNVGRFGDAEKLRALVLENDRLGSDRSVELAKWKETYEAKRASTVQQTEEQVKTLQKEVQTIIRDAVNAEFQKFGVKSPSAPDPSAPLPVRQAHQKKVEEFNRIVGEFGERFKGVVHDPRKSAPELATGMFVRHFVVPKLQSTIESLQAEVQKLNGQISAYKKSGAISQTHAKISPDARPSSQRGGAPEMTVESLTDLAKQLGMNTGS